MTLRVEFLGPPAVGKTTLATAVCERLDSAGHPCRLPTTRLAGQPRWRRIPTKAALASGHAVRAPTQTLAHLRAIAGTDQQTIDDFLRVAFNWQFVCGLHTRGGDGVVLLDQGVFQALWSIGWRASDWAAVRALALSPSLLPDILVVLTAEQATIRERLATREGGDTRVDPADIGRAQVGIDHVHTLAEEYERALGRPATLLGDTTEPGPTEGVVDHIAEAIEQSLDS